jgi:hypothetical protein
MSDLHCARYLILHCSFKGKLTSKSNAIHHNHNRHSIWYHRLFPRGKLLHAIYIMESNIDWKNEEGKIDWSLFLIAI